MNTAELITFLRFWLADLPTSTINDDSLELILDSVRSQYTSASDCQLQYYFVIATLEWLIRKDAKGSAGTVGGGEISSRKEKIGDVEVSTTYAVGTSTGVATGWDKVLENLRKNPDSIGCTVFPVTSGSSSSSGTVLFGGTSQAEYDRVKDNADSRSGWNTSSPWRESLYKKNW